MRKPSGGCGLPVSPLPRGHLIAPGGVGRGGREREEARNVPLHWPRRLLVAQAAHELVDEEVPGEEQEEKEYLKQL